MSYRVMPFVYLNMGGEMAYILEQRLQAQNVGNDKSIKVLCDIIATMFAKSFLELIFEPQELYSKTALRQFFEQIAHSSVMRLNEASMDKLFDLMTMAVKYQVLLCKEPSELVLVTLNHLDGVKAIFKDHDHILECIDHAHTLLMDNFVETPLWEMAAIRSEVLNYLLGSRVKVSLMLREKRQLEDGRFVLFGNEGDSQIELPYSAVVPGTVRYFSQGEVSHVDEFPVTEHFKMSEAHQHGMAMPMMSRGTTLGHNMYRSHESNHMRGTGGTGARVGTPPAGNEVQFLQHLLQQQQQNVATFDLSLFEDEREEKIFLGLSTGNDSVDKTNSEDVHKFDICTQKKSLSSAVKEMKVGTTKEEEQPEKSVKGRARGTKLLDMMDEAASDTAGTHPKSKQSSSKPLSRAASAKRKASSGSVTKKT